MNNIYAEMQRQSQGLQPANFICEECAYYDGGIGCKQNIFIAFKGANMRNCHHFKAGIRCPHCGKRFLMKKLFINTAWDWDEVSARNCRHAKVFLKNGKPMVYCKEGHRLGYQKKSADGKGGARLSNVLRNPTHIPKPCRDCEDFRHDVPVRRTI